MSGKGKKPPGKKPMPKGQKAKEAAKSAKAKDAAKSAEALPKVLGTDENDALRCRGGLIYGQRRLNELQRAATKAHDEMMNEEDEAQQPIKLKTYRLAQKAVKYQQACMARTEEQIVWLDAADKEEDDESLGLTADRGEEKESKLDSKHGLKEAPAEPPIDLTKEIKEMSRKAAEQQEPHNPDAGTKQKYKPIPKLVPPKKSFDGTEDWTKTSRWMTVWQKDLAPHYEDDEIGRKLMEVISGKAENSVNSIIPEGNETYTGIIAALKRFYGKRVAQQTSEKEHALTTHSRDGAMMADFIKEHVMRMSEAQAVGEEWSATTAGMKLLKAAQLSVSQRATIIANLKTRERAMGKDGDGNPSYDGVLEELWGLADSYAAADEGKAKKAKKKDGAEDKTALLGVDGDHANADGKKKWRKGDRKGKGDKGKGKGGKGNRKGKGDKGKGKGGRSKKKAFWGEQQSQGGWNQQGGKGWGTGGWNSWDKDKKEYGDGVCHFYARGETCPWGKDCRFKHEGQQRKKEETTSRKRDGAQRDGRKDDGWKGRKRPKVVDSDSE